MKKTNLLKSMLLLCALVAGSGNVWAGDIIYSWDGSGNTTTGNEIGGTATAKGGNSNIVVGNSQKGNYTFKLNKGFSSGTYYVEIALTNALKGGEKVVVGAFRTSSSSDGELGFDFGTTVTQTLKSNPVYLSSNGIPDDLEYTVPAAAAGSKTVRVYRNSGSTGVYVSKFVIISNEASSPLDGFPVATISHETCTYSKPTWTHDENSAYTLKATDNTDIPTKDYSGATRIKITYGKTYTVTVPSGITITKVAIKGASTNTSTGTPITIGATSQTFRTLDTKLYSIASSSAGASISFSVADKEFGLESIVLYTADGITLETTANMDGWRAFYDGSQAYTADENTSVYVADSDPEGSTITLKNIGKGIPFGVPVILKTSAVDHKIVLTKGGSATYSGTNNLAVTDGTNDVSSKYRLGYNSTDGVGFYPYSATKPAAGIVYLNIDASAHALSIDFEEGDVTGIAEVSAKKEFKGEYFNLAGQRVDANHKGIVIVNGKKFFNK